MVQLRGIPKMFTKQNYHIFRGDMVEVVSGRYRGQIGKVLKVKRHEQRPFVWIEGVNMKTRFLKQGEGQPKRKVRSEGPLDYYLVNLVDPVTKRHVRCSTQYLEDGTKVRVGRGKFASGSVIPKPPEMLERKAPRLDKAGPRDTPVAVVLQRTYVPGQDTYGIQADGQTDVPQKPAQTVGGGLLEKYFGRGRRKYSTAVNVDGVLGLQSVGSGELDELAAQMQRQRVWRAGSALSFAAGPVWRGMFVQPRGILW